MNFSRRIVDVYSNLHTRIPYTNNSNISFDGSQKQSEFFKCWQFIKNYYLNGNNKNISFLEIGAWKGLWGIAFGEFCRELNIVGKYTTVTLIDQDLNNQSLYKTTEYLKTIGIESTIINGDSTKDDTLNNVKNISDTFDIVLIDGSHHYKDVMIDISKYFPLANDMVLFHDIKPKYHTENVAVYSAIKDSNLDLSVEFTDGDDTMGIGIIIK